MDKSTLFTTIFQYSDTHNLLPAGSKVVVGFSGGPDSLFLLHALNNLRSIRKIELIAAHLDHEWRAESGSEALFCHQVAIKLGIPFVQAQLTKLDFTPKWTGSKEELGRNARRFFFESVAREHGASCIALAHHAHDQQETFFLRLLRGASLSGLTGMKPKQCAHAHHQGLYIRPLLSITKPEILTYLHEQNLPYLTDPSNTSPVYLRNRIRSTVIPALRTCDDRFDKNFLSTITRLQETETFLDALAQEKLAALGTPRNIAPEQSTTSTASISPAPVTNLDIPAFMKMAPVLRYRVLLAWLCQHQLPFEPTQAFLDEIMRFLQTPHGGRHTMHPSWQLVKCKRTASIEKL